MSAPVTLLVIAKAPVPGRVKTRLCPPCTPAQAAALAEAALADTLEVVAATPARARVLALEGPTGAWLPSGFDVVAQSGGGLDHRLAAAFAAVEGPAVLIGMDTPQVTVSLLCEAADALLTPGRDVVLGPASDGGWWAIGLRRPDPRVFLGVEMSTAHTGARQSARLVELGLRSHRLPELRDVDSFADALAVAAVAPSSRFARALGGIDVRDELPVAVG